MKNLTNKNKSVKPKKINKQAVTRKFKSLGLRGQVDFDIELHEGVLYVHNSINLNIEIPYSDAKAKKRIYNALWLLVDVFDFSFTVSFYTLKALEEFVMSGIAPQKDASGPFGSIEATQRLEYDLVADNLMLQEGDDVELLFESNFTDTWLRQSKRVAREGNVITSNWDAILHQKTANKELNFSIVTKMTLRFMRTIREDGKQMNTIVAVEGLGVFAWARNERGSTDQLKPLEKRLNVSQMYRGWYVNILKACIDGDNKNNPNKDDIWVVADRLEDMYETND